MVLQPPLFQVRGNALLCCPIQVYLFDTTGKQASNSERESVCVCVSLCLSVCVCDEHAQSGSTTTASNAKGFGAWGRGRGKKVLWQGRPTTSSHRKHGSSEQVEKGSGAWAHHHHQVAKGGGCVWVWVHRQWCRNHHNGSDWTRTRAAFLLQ